MLSKRNQTQNTTYCITIYIRYPSFPKKYIHIYLQEQISSSPGQEEKISNTKFEISLEGNRNVLKLATMVMTAQLARNNLISVNIVKITQLYNTFNSLLFSCVARATRRCTRLT